MPATSAGLNRLLFAAAINSRKKQTRQAECAVKKPSLMFAGKAGAYPSAPLQDRPLALPTNIRLGCRGLPGTNTLAYYENT